MESIEWSLSKKVPITEYCDRKVLIFWTQFVVTSSSIIMYFTLRLFTAQPYRHSAWQKWCYWAACKKYPPSSPLITFHANTLCSWIKGIPHIWQYFRFSSVNGIGKSISFLIHLLCMVQSIYLHYTREACRKDLSSIISFILGIMNSLCGRWSILYGYMK